MRTISDYRSFTVQLGTAVQQAHEAQTRVDELLSNRIIVNSMSNNGKQLAAIEAQLSQLTTQRDAIFRALATISKRPNFESAVELLTDVRVRIDQANEMYMNTRRARAVFDLNAALNNFAEEGQQGVTRAQAEAQIATAEKEYNTALGLIEELVPAVSSPSIILAE